MFHQYTGFLYGIVLFMFHQYTGFLYGIVLFMFHQYTGFLYGIVLFMFHQYTGFFLNFHMNSVDMATHLRTVTLKTNSSNDNNAV
jgi:hypothetical protein